MLNQDVEREGDGCQEDSKQAGAISIMVDGS